MIDSTPLPNLSSSALLLTKLRPPRLNAAMIDRWSVWKQLNQGLDRRLTLVSAPAGFGKSTTIAQWLAQTSLPGAWLSLDRGDNDPVRFWQYVITSCQSFAPHIGLNALAMLQKPREHPFEAALTSFVNDLTQLVGRHVLVLEDYHVLESKMIHDSIAHWIEHLPETIHLILITRHDPPLPLARLRAHAEINELRASDLQFSADEIRSFFEQRLSVALSVQNVTELERRTEGWIVGLQIASLLLQRCQQPHDLEAFFSTFTGGHRHILEYLVTEVFTAQPEAVQDFLLQTAFLPRFNSSLCDFVTGRDDSASVLKRLEAANLFLIPLDETQQWYRYHDLFAEAMQHYASSSLSAPEVCALYHRASLWHEAHHHMADAVEAALSARLYDRAADLIEKMLNQFHLDNELYTLRRWVELMPETVLQAHPELCLQHARAIIFTSDRHAPATLDRVQKPLYMAQETWQAQGNTHKQGEVIAVRSLIEYWQGHMTQWILTARQALMLLDHGTEWRGIMLLHTATHEFLNGDSEAARCLIEDENLLVEVAGNEYATRSTINLLAHVSIYQGRPYEAQQRLQDILDAAGKDLRHRTHALLNLGGIAFENNELDPAQTYALEACEIAERLRDQVLLADSTILMARLKQAQGETAHAQQMLQEKIARVQVPPSVRQMRAWMGWIDLMAGDISKAQGWYSTYAAQHHGASTIQREQEALIGVRLLIVQGNTEAAHALLDTWYQSAQVGRRTRRELEILIVRALAFFAEHDLIQARDSLLSALQLAHPVGYARLFLQEGEAMISLLNQVSRVSDKALSAYIHNLLRAFHQEHAQNAAASRLVLLPLEDRLSPQEQRVLRLLGDGLSTPEIAETLSVSINTIKTQVKSIYSKLNLNNRKDARIVARQMHLM